MPRLFLTYAWRDNTLNNVDVLRQTLQQRGVEVDIDRWNIVAGRRLWDQIDAAINAPDLDGWAIYATRASLQSEPCREELAYALDRALSRKGDDFPLIGIFPEPLPREEIPTALRIRRYVLLSEPDWAETVRAGLVGTAPREPAEHLAPFRTRWHTIGQQDVLEITPRIEFWYPAFAAVPREEAAAVGLMVISGPPGHMPSGAIVSAGPLNAEVGGTMFSGEQIDHQITPNHSLYLVVRQRPSRFVFGAVRGPHYTMPGQARTE